MLRFEDVGDAKIRCGLAGGKQSRVGFAFSTGWIPYVCCDETVIGVASFDDLRTHVRLLSLDSIALSKFCRFFDPQKMNCAHEATTVIPRK